MTKKPTAIFDVYIWSCYKATRKGVTMGISDFDLASFYCYDEAHERLVLQPLERSLGLLTWQAVTVCIESPQVFVVKTPTEILARILYETESHGVMEYVIVRTDLLAIHRQLFYNVLREAEVSFERLRPYLDTAR